MDNHLNIGIPAAVAVDKHKPVPIYFILYFNGVVFRSHLRELLKPENTIPQAPSGRGLYRFGMDIFLVCIFDLYK